MRGSCRIFSFNICINCIQFDEFKIKLFTFNQSHLPAPKIFGGEINLVETQELKIPELEVKFPGSRNIHHISPKPVSPRPRMTQTPLIEVLKFLFTILFLSCFLI